MDETHVSHELLRWNVHFLLFLDSVNHISFPFSHCLDTAWTQQPTTTRVLTSHNNTWKCRYPLSYWRNVTVVSGYNLWWPMFYISHVQADTTRKKALQGTHSTLGWIHQSARRSADWLSFKVAHCIVAEEFVPILNLLQLDLGHMFRHSIETKLENPPPPPLPPPRLKVPETAPTKRTIKRNMCPQYSNHQV